VAIVLNGVFLAARLRSIGGDPNDYADVWNERTVMGMSAAQLENLANGVMLFLGGFSLANMVYVFSKTRRYQLRQNEQIRPWKLGGRTKVLNVWDPPRFGLFLFSMCSPLGLLIIQGGEDWMYRTGLAFLLACTLYLITASFVRLSKDQLLVSSQVMREYDEVFVQPRLFPTRKNQAQQVGGGTRRKNLMEELMQPTSFFRQPTRTDSSAINRPTTSATSSTRIIDIR